MATGLQQIPPAGLTSVPQIATSMSEPCPPRLPCLLIYLMIGSTAFEESRINWPGAKIAPDVNTRRSRMAKSERESRVARVVMTLLSCCLLMSMQSRA